MLKVSLNGSRWLVGILSAAHAAAAASIVVADLPTWVKGVLLLLVAASWAVALHGPALRRGGKAIVALELAEDGRLSFQTRAGEWHEATLLESSFVAPYLTVLNLQLDGQRFLRYVVIVPDAIGTEDFRRIRVWLRWRKEHRAEKKK